MEKSDYILKTYHFYGITGILHALNNKEVFLFDIADIFGYDIVYSSIDMIINFPDEKRNILYTKFFNKWVAI